MTSEKKINIGDSVQCQLFEKKGMVTDVYDISLSCSGDNQLTFMVKLIWEDGKEEIVNTTEYPQRLKMLSDVEAEKAQLDAFGADLADIDIH